MDHFVDYAKPLIEKEEIEEVIDTLTKGWLTMGPKTKLFEDKFKEYVNSPFAIAVNSCTGALHLALIVAGIKEGDEVITTPFTFAATGEVIAYLKAKPVLVDIEEGTYNIDIKKIEEKITPNTKAIIPVHYGGHPCEMNEIIEIAKKYNLKIIEDAAHAIGSKYKEKNIGTIGDFTAFSFYATKNLATGEGGMITTKKIEYENRLKILRLHGISKDAWKRYTQEGTWKYDIVEQGYKYNITDIQSSLGIHQLAKIDRFNEVREKYARIYDSYFKNNQYIQLQEIKNYVKHSRHLYVIRIDFEKLNINRDQFIIELNKKNIGTSVHFIPLHLHTLYQKRFGYKKGDFPVTEKVYENIISLPLYPAMTKSQIRYVSNTVNNLITLNIK
jgi:dTDP-4-amino-4,6-dideoxygalactose transaminase